jgi:hypothetical protein
MGKERLVVLKKTPGNTVLDKLQLLNYYTAPCLSWKPKIHTTFKWAHYWNLTLARLLKSFSVALRCILT